MASSAALTTTHLPRLRKELEQWRQKQPSVTPFSSLSQDITTQLGSRNLNAEQGKDVIVAFRTRPPLENEAEEKFQAATTVPPGGETEAPVQFCPGITVTSNEPGVFVAHVPGMKVLFIST
jgi:kinesin family member 2/24